MKQDWLKQLDELDVDSLCINTLRTLAIDMIQKADSGHPGAPMGCAPMAYLLWSKHMKHNPKDPHWFDRDRFVLSNGHGSSLLYSLLHLSGYAVSLDGRAVVITQPEAGTIAGYDATCPHQGCTVRAGDDGLVCPCQDRKSVV